MNEQKTEEVRIQVYHMGEEPVIDPYIAKLSMGERIELAWQITRQTWIMMGKDPDAPFRRDVECVTFREC